MHWHPWGIVKSKKWYFSLKWSNNWDFASKIIQEREQSVYYFDPLGQSVIFWKSSVVSLIFLIHWGCQCKLSKRNKITSKSKNFPTNIQNIENMLNFYFLFFYKSNKINNKWKKHFQDLKPKKSKIQKQNDKRKLIAISKLSLSLSLSHENIENVTKKS